MKPPSFAGSPCTRRDAIKTIGASLVCPAIPFAQTTDEIGPTQKVNPRQGPSTLLFFDDEPLYSRKGVVRRLGTPQRAGSYHEKAGNCTWGRPSVFRVQDEWRMVYQAGVGLPNRGGGVTLIASSLDGVVWAPLDTTAQIVLPGRMAANQILPTTAGNLGSVVEDLSAPASERYKLLAVRETVESSIWVSADLLQWRKLEQSSWHPSPPDPPAFAFWNDAARSFFITTRPEWPDRRICLVTTKDWRTFSRPVLALHADADDRALAQHYGMYVLPYHGYFIGLLWIFYAGDAAPLSAPHRYRGGKVETYLTYSLNGLHWQRCTHTPLFVNGGAGLPDAGCLQVSNIIPAGKGRLRVYAACSTREPVSYTHLTLPTNREV